MMRILLLTGMMLALTSCAAIQQSRLNPGNWFEREDTSEPVENLPLPVNDPRPLVAQVTSLRIDPTPEGAIIWAVGLPATQGYWQADLVRVDTSPGVLSYAFRAAPPVAVQPQGTSRLARDTYRHHDLGPRPARHKGDYGSGRAEPAQRPALGLFA